MSWLPSQMVSTTVTVYNHGLVLMVSTHGPSGQHGWSPKNADDHEQIVEEAMKTFESELRLALKRIAVEQKRLKAQRLKWYGD